MYLCCAFYFCFDTSVIADESVTRVCSVSHAVMNRMKAWLILDSTVYMHIQVLGLLNMRCERALFCCRWEVRQCWHIMSVPSCLFWQPQVISASNSTPSCYLPQRSRLLSSISDGFLRNWWVLPPLNPVSISIQHYYSVWNQTIPLSLLSNKCWAQFTQNFSIDFELFFLVLLYAQIYPKTLYI